MSSTPVAHTAVEVVRLAEESNDLAELVARESVCRACPRLVEWRETVAVQKRKSFADQTYWGRPVPGWGSDQPAILIVGLAPAAHGGNRTGRIFTGDRSGEWLFASLYRQGLAVSPAAERADDGQRLLNARVVAAVRCAPPDNKPTIEERDTCEPWLTREVRLALPSVRSVVALGSYAWDAALRAFRAIGIDVPKPKPRFGHAAEAHLGNDITLIGSFHPSQQNTFTGKLTEPMLDAVFARAKDCAGPGE